MGCIQSKSSSSPSAAGPGASGSGGPGRLTTSEVESRIDAPARTITTSIGGAKVRYGYVSQRGFYPDEPKKANQDAYAVVGDFGGKEGEAMFAVFDGHGKEGDVCSQFVKADLPERLRRDLAGVQEGGKQEVYERACCKR